LSTLRNQRFLKSPQQAEGYSREIFRFATSNFCLLKSVAASCWVFNPDFKINNFPYQFIEYAVLINCGINSKMLAGINPSIL